MLLIYSDIHHQIICMFGLFLQRHVPHVLPRVTLLELTCLNLSGLDLPTMVGTLTIGPSSCPARPAFTVNDPLSTTIADLSHILQLLNWTRIVWLKQWIWCYQNSNITHTMSVEALKRSSERLPKSVCYFKHIDKYCNRICHKGVQIEIELL